MASSGKQLNVRMNFQVDTTQAQQQLKVLTSQLNQITSPNNFGRNAQLGITSQIIEATKAAGQLKVALAEATNPLTGNLDLTKFNDQLRTSGMSLQKYRETLSVLGSTGNQTFSQLARSIATAEAPMLRVGKAAQTMWTVLGNTVRWQATSSILHGIMSTASQAMGYVKSLDHSLNSIRIVTGQSQEQMVRFAKTANQAAKELNTSTNEYAKASLIYYQQGLSNKQVEERTRATIKLANVAGQSAKTASDQLTAIWNNFYDGSKSLEYYADVITALGASTASSSEEIAKGLQKFSSIAQTTGLSYEYATSALSTVVAATRQSADSVGTSFKTLFSRLQGLSLGEVLDDGTTLNKYSQALNTVGVNIKKANGDLKDMDTILDELGSKWSSLGQDTKVALAQTVGGVRNYTGLMSLMEHWDEFQTNLKTAQTAQGTLQAQADIYAESWQAASAHVKAASETIYKNLLDDKFFKGLTNGFGTILDMVGGLTTGLGGFRGSMLALSNTALQLFKPQITGALGTLGLNLRGIVKGQEDIVNLKNDAAQALLAPVQFSRYGQVNTIQQNINKTLVDRQNTYDALVSQGKIPQHLQPVYQMMFNAANAQSDQAVASAEAAFASKEATQMNQTRFQQNLNYYASQYQKSLDSTASGEYTNQYGNPLKLSETMKTGFANYEQLSRASNVASTINLLGKQNFTEMSNDDAVNMASYITQVVAGSKAMGMNFEDTIPILTEVNAQISDYQTQLQNGTITQEQFTEAVGKYLRNNTDLTTQIEEFISGDQGQALIAAREGLISTAQGAAGVTAESERGKQIRTELEGILSQTDMTTAQQVDAMRKLGIQESTAAAYLAKMKEQGQVKSTMDMSGALVTSMNVIAASGQIISSIQRTYDVFKNESSTASDYLGAFTSSAMSISMAVKPWKEFKTHAKDAVKLFGSETGMTVGQLGGWTAALTALAIVGTKVYQGYAQNYTTKGQLTTISGELAAQQQTVSDKKARKEELETLTDQYNKQLIELNNSIRGTSGYYNTQADINTSAGNLISQYGLKIGEDFTVRNGTMVIDQATQARLVEQADREYLQSVQQQNILAQTRNYYAATRQLELRNKALGLEGAGLYESGGAIYQLSSNSQDISGDYQIYSADEVKRLRESDSAYQTALAQQTSSLRTIAELAMDDLAAQSKIELNDFVKAAFLNRETLDTEMEDILNTVNTATIDGFWKSMGSWFSGNGITGYEGVNSNKDLWEVLTSKGFVSGEMPTTDEALRGALRGAMPAMLMESRFTEFTSNPQLAAIATSFEQYRNQTVFDVQAAIRQQLSSDEYKAYRDALLQDIQDTQVNLQEALGSNLSSAYLSQHDLNNDTDSIMSGLLPYYSLNELQRIADYTISAGSVFGTGTTQTVVEALSNSKNTEVLKQLGKINWDNTFSALGDINKLARNLGGQSNLYSDILNSAIDDLGGEGGLFKKLYDSSGFQGVLDSLTEEFDRMGEITTGTVTKLASKSEELADLLGLSNSEFANLNINAAGIADILTQINKGILTSSQVTTQLVSSISTANALEAERYNAFDVVDNMNLGRSGTDLFEFFTNPQKAFYTAKSQNLTFDEPLRNVFEHMMPESIRKSYINAIQNGSGKSFDEIISQLPQKIQNYLKDTTKKGKTSLSWAETIDLFGDFFANDSNAFTVNGTEFKNAEEYLKSMGITFQNGNIHLEETDSHLTTENIKEYLINTFQRGLGYSAEDAQSMAEVWLGYIDSTSAGSLVRSDDAQAAVGQYISDFKTQNYENGQHKTGLLYQDELDALWNSYGMYMPQNFENQEDFEKYILSQLGKENYVFAPDRDYLKDSVWGTNVASYYGIGRAYAAANGVDRASELSDAEAEEQFKQFLDIAGIRTQDNKIDIDKLRETVLAMGGTEEDLGEILTSDVIQQLGGITGTFTDKFGNTHTIEALQGESYNDYLERRTAIENEANSDYYWDPTLGDYVFDPLGKKRENIDTLNAMATGTVVSENGQTSQAVIDYWQTGERPQAAETVGELAAKEIEQRYGISRNDLKQDSKGNWYYEQDGVKRSLGIYYQQQANKMGDTTISNQKDINNWYTQNQGIVAAGAKSYANAISNKLAAGGDITQGQSQLLSLWNTYNGLDDKTKQSPYGIALLKKMDNLIYNTDTIAGETGNLVELQEGEEKGDDTRNKKATTADGKEVTNEEDLNNVDLPQNGRNKTTAPNGEGWKPTDIEQKDKDNAQRAQDQADKSGNRTSYTDSSGITTYYEPKKKAHGQNNHTLSFASGSKGEIAVTGELGPELRIKEDGSADLLGKKGREYAWVNPGDRIYTATQTASILGSNNIPQLEGLAKGIRNRIPGYAGSINLPSGTYVITAQQSGGATGEASAYNSAGIKTATGDNPSTGFGGYYGRGGKKTDPRYDPNTLKARDVIERYYTILQQIDDITKAVEYFAAVADRAWGKDRIKAINEQIKMEEKQIEAQKRYLAEIQNNLRVDKTALTTMITDFIKEYKKAGLGELPASGIEFDENGIIANYSTVVQGFLDAYNKNPLAHAADKKYQYKFQERLKDIQMYTESLNLLEEQEEQLLNLQNQLFDTKLQKIQVELEYKTSLVDDDLNILSYQLGKVKDNAFLAAEAVDIMGQQYDASIKKLGLQQDALRDLFALHLPDFANTTYNLTQEESELTKQLQNLEDLRAVFDNDNKEINRGKKAKIKGEDKANYTDEEKAFLESLGLYYLDENKKKHYIDDYYSSIETLYKDMYSRYSDKLPNPEDFFIHKDIKIGDKTKTYLLNYADVLQKLIDLNNQLTKNDILQEFDENGNLTNAEEVSEKVVKLYEELKERMPDVDIELKWNEENSKVLDNYREVLDAINEANSQLFDNSAIGDMFENGDWWKAFIDDGANFFDMLSSLPGYTDLTAQEVETLRNTISAMLGELKSMQEAYENMFDTLGDTIKAYGKELNTQIGYFDHYEKMISSYKNILDLTGRNTLEISRQITNTMMSKSVDNAINKLKGAKAAYEAMAATVADTSQRLAKAEADYLKNQNSETTATLDLARQTYQNALSQYHDMEESYMQAWEDALQRAQDAFQTVVAAAAKNFEASFSPMYTSLEQLSNAFNREKELQELYVHDYQRIHDLNKLMRDLDQAIIDTDNIAGKEKLRDLLEEITDLQESGVELSEYDLDILQKRFDLELARQNLEDARDAKSLVRLARDNNGNWGYVYTANEDDVAEAEQKYEDAILAMEQANEEYVMNLSSLLDNLFSDTKNQMESLSLASFNYDTEAYLKELTKIADAAMTEATFYGDQLTNAFSNNSDLMRAVINSFQGSLGNLTTSLGDTLLGSLLTVDNPEALKDLIADNINTLVSDIATGAGLFDPINDVYGAIDKDVGSIGDEIEDQMEKIGDSSKENLTDTLTLVDRITTAFDSLTVSLDNLIATMTSPEAKDMIKAYENIVEQLNKFIEGTANYLPGNQESIAFEKGVEDWDTFNTILEALKKNGNISVKTMEMNENGEYGLVTRSAEQVLQIMPEWRRMLGENTIYTAEKLASMTLDDYNQLVDTYMNGNKIFKFHINNASDRKKLGAEFGLDEEGNLLVDTTTPEGKAEAQRLLEWLQVNGKKIKKGFKNQNLTDISTLHAQGGLEYNTGWSWLDGTLREPELVLNAGETKDFLKAVDILRTIDLNAKAMSNGYGSLGISGINTIPGVLEQEVTIHAEFPNAVDHYEIEQAFDNLVNKASQYANRK